MTEPLLCRPEDLENEAAVAAYLAQVWRCEVVSFGKLSPIDFYAHRNGQMTALIELKCRSHRSDKYDTVFLSVRKWLALALSEASFGVPSLYVVRFTDALLWIRWAQIDARSIRITGHRDPRRRLDIEPCILLPVADMRSVGGGLNAPSDHVSGGVAVQDCETVPRGTDQSSPDAEPVEPEETQETPAELEDFEQVGLDPPI